MQSHAQVYVSASGRSWHGTSVQCVEPMPVSGIINTAKPTSQTVDAGALPPLIRTPTEHVTSLYKRLTVSPAGTPSQRQVCKKQQNSGVLDSPNSICTNMEVEATLNGFHPPTMDAWSEGDTSEGLNHNASALPSASVLPDRSHAMDTWREEGTNEGLKHTTCTSVLPDHSHSKDTWREGGTTTSPISDHSHSMDAWREGSVGKESSLPNAPVLSLSNVPWGEGSIGKGLEYQLLFCFYLSFHPMIFGIVSVNSVCLYFLHHIHSLSLF